MGRVFVVLCFALSQFLRALDSHAQVCWELGDSKNVGHIRDHFALLIIRCVKFVSDHICSVMQREVIL